MKKNIFMALALVALCVSGAFAGSKSRAQYNYDMPRDGITHNVWLNWTDIAAASNTSFKNTTISTATLVAAATTFELANADYTDTIVPRNVVIISSVQVPASYSGIAVITGVDHRGYAASESVEVSTWTGTSMGTGNIAWSSITSIALTTTATDATALNIQIGGGNKIGLCSKLTSAAQLLKVIEAGSLSTTYTASTTYGTITFNSAPNGTNDYQAEMAIGEK